MNMSLDRILVEEVALAKGINETFIEKDWYVTKVIKLLASFNHLDYYIVFTGGTALSKAHKIIQRFSEDIDFRLIAPSLDGVSSSQTKKALSVFKKDIAVLLEPHFAIDRIDAKDGNRHITIELTYPSLYTIGRALRPYIKLEFTLSKLSLSSIYLPVSSLINEVSNQQPEIEKIACINPVENAADKLSALTWRVASRIRGENDRQPDVVRHLHDLAMLSEQAIESPDFSQLLRTTLERDNDRSEAIKGLSIPEKIVKTLVILETDTEYVNEYKTFVNGMSYAQDGSVPSFKEAVDKLRMIASRVVLFD